MDKIQIGDKVQLKSGGPEMMVDTVDENSAKCVWFDGYNTKEKVFKQALLAIIDSNASHIWVQKREDRGF